MLGFIRNSQIIFQSCYTILYSQQQSMGVPAFSFCTVVLFLVHFLTSSMMWALYRHSLQYSQGFPGGSGVRNLPACQAGDVGSIPGWGKIPWRRKWQPTPVFLPEKSHGQRSLVGYSPWDHKRVGHDLVPKWQYSCLDWTVDFISFSVPWASIKLEIKFSKVKHIPLG